MNKTHLLSVIFFITLLLFSTSCHNSAVRTGSFSGSKETEYTAADASTLKNDIKQTIISGETDNYQPGEGIEKSFDNDMSTLYHSRWNNSAENYFPFSLTYNFDSADIDYFIYYPRTSGWNGHFKECEILVRKNDSNNFDKIMDYNFKGSSSPSVIRFPETLKNINSVRIVIKSGAGDGKGFASCAQIEFYKNNPEEFDPLKIFRDKTCSSLKRRVKPKDIENISSPFHKNIAIHLLSNSYPAEFRIQEYKAYPHPDMYAARNKTSSYSLLDNATGIYVEKDDDLIIFAGDLHKQNISIRIQNLDRPGGDGFGGSSYPLCEGLNKIKVKEKGLIYVMYHSEDYKSLPPVKIHFASGKVNGYFDVTRHNEADWKRLLGKTTAGYFDVLGKYTHLTFPVEDFRQYTKCGKDLIETYDEIARLQMELMGLMKYDRVFANRIYLHVMYHSYMYATSYHTGYNASTCSAILNTDNLKTNGIWGPAHEIGHCNQTRPGLLWAGMTEVTNNIHSLYVQTSFGNVSRLQGESLAYEGMNNRYEKALNNIVVNKIPHAAEGDVFCKLVPMWQLQLYISEVLGIKDFYKDIHEDIRNTGNSDQHGENQLNFVLRSCKAAKLDLTDFFFEWGFLNPVSETIDDYGHKTIDISAGQIENLKMEIKKLNYPAPSHNFKYICDDNIELFKTSASVKKGSAIIDGQTVIMNDWKNVAAYEVIRNGSLIYVSQDASFKVKTPLNEDFEIYAVDAKGKKIRVDF